MFMKTKFQAPLSTFFSTLLGWEEWQMCFMIWLDEPWKIPEGQMQCICLLTGEMGRVRQVIWCMLEWIYQHKEQGTK